MSRESRQRLNPKQDAPVLYVHLWVGLGLILLGCWSVTHYVAYRLGYSSQLGAPLWVDDGYPWYAPWAWWEWFYHFDAYAPRVFVHAWMGFMAWCLLVSSGWIGWAIRRKGRAAKGETFGSSRWATDRELEQGGLLNGEGVVLAQTYDAHYRFAFNKETGENAWVMKRPGRGLLQHNGPEHVLCFAPTRSGKGAGVVIPTLLSWRFSTIVYDIKKELWAATAGWRRTFTHCWRFEPTAPDSIRFNPLWEIRRGDHDVRDAQTVADILVDPDGSKNRLDHWEKTAHTLLVATILHVLYAEEDKSLTGVANTLSNPSCSLQATLQRMMTCHHVGECVHPVVASCIREMLNKSENELSGVVSTALTFLSLYRDPIIARNTAVSDFSLDQLMSLDRPVSLYLVVPPSDIERTKPLLRLMLNQIGRRLTETMPSREEAFKRHRMLMMMDEFPSLGRLALFETDLAYLAGYGIKCFLIAQSLNQLEKIYGAHHAILDNAHVRVTYASLDDRTAKRISDLLGQSTEQRTQVNLSGRRWAAWLDRVSESEHESARPLLTPGEILQLPSDEALVLVGNMPPYRAKKIMYFLDKRFLGRAHLSPPDSPAEQAEELKGVECKQHWHTPVGSIERLAIGREPHHHSRQEQTECELETKSELESEIEMTPVEIESEAMHVEDADGTCEHFERSMRHRKDPAWSRTTEWDKGGIPL